LKLRKRLFFGVTPEKIDANFAEPAFAYRRDDFTRNEPSCERSVGLRIFEQGIP
jgi:hypothetical protein